MLRARTPVAAGEEVEVIEHEVVRRLAVSSSVRLALFARPRSKRFRELGITKREQRHEALRRQKEFRLGPARVGVRLPKNDFWVIQSLESSCDLKAAEQSQVVETVDCPPPYFVDGDDLLGVKAPQEKRPSRTG